MTELRLPDDLRLDIEASVATLVIDRPARRNAFSLAMWQAIPQIAATVEAAAAVRALVIRGAGDGPFCAGADISEFATVRQPGEPARQYSVVVHAAERSLANLSKPTIALIQGWCVGGGCELALACDLRVADETARFAITASKLGIVYSQSSTARLVEVVGAPWARYLLMTGEMVDAAQALRIGLVHEIHPVSGAAAAASRLAGILVGRAPISLAGAKQLIDRVAADTAAEDGWTQRWYAAAAASAEYAEGVAAFAAKRSPDFTTALWPTLGTDNAPI